MSKTEKMPVACLQVAEAELAQVLLTGLPSTGLQQLRAWMRAELFLTNFRPVPLTEHAVFQGCVYVKV